MNQIKIDIVHLNHLIQRVNNGNDLKESTPLQDQIKTSVVADECDKYFGADLTTEDFNVAFEHRCYDVVMDQLPCCGYENDIGGLWQFCKRRIQKIATLLSARVE